MFYTESVFFSNEILILGSEIENTFKKLIGLCGGDVCSTIVGYKEFILENYPEIRDFQVKVLGTDITLKPFFDCVVNKRIDWWDTYNAIKHGSGNSETERPTLLTALNMLAAFYILLFLVHVKEKSDGEACYYVTEIPKLLGIISKIGDDDRYGETTILFTRTKDCPTF